MRGVASFVPKIKFCGITDPADADAAVEAGAWALGVILWPGSRRRCRLEVAAQIAAQHRRHVQIVGVFVNPTLETVARAADEIGLTAVQLHGDEGPMFCGEVARRTGCRVIKAARVRSGADIQALTPYHTDYHLLDSYTQGMPGGTGETFAWELALDHRGSIPVILSGGLTPDNVADAIELVHPYAVDVASGVDDPQRAPRKDPERLQAFAAAVAGPTSSALRVGLAPNSEGAVVDGPPVPDPEPAASTP
jgi:phosphoribosylanthranilate isomerase